MAGRKPLPLAEKVGPEFVGATPLDMAQEQNALLAAYQSTAAAYDPMQAVGRMQMGVFMATVADRVVSETFMQVKESGSYKNLPYRDASGEWQHVSTLEEFCEQFMPHGYRRCRQLAENYRLLGPELYEQAEAIGFRQRDYNALKALPADDQAIVRQAVEAGKLDTAIELLEDMAAKHVAEKAALEKVASEATANYAALDKNLQRTLDRANKAEREADKLRHRLEAETPDEAGKALRLEVSGHGYHIEGQINTDLMKAFDALAHHAAQHDCSHDEFMSGVLFGIERALLAVRNKHHVKDRPDGDERPDWTRPDFDADAVVAAALAKLEPGHE